MFPKRLPFPRHILNTAVKVVIYSDGLDEDTGEPKTALEWQGKCNWSEKTKRIINAQNVVINLVGTVIIEGDIAPSIDTLEGGKVFIGSRTFTIHSSARGRNLDGSVFSTELYLF